MANVAIIDGALQLSITLTTTFSRQGRGSSRRVGNAHHWPRSLGRSTAGTGERSSQRRQPLLPTFGHTVGDAHPTVNVV